MNLFIDIVSLMACTVWAVAFYGASFDYYEKRTGFLYTALAVTSSILCAATAILIFIYRILP